MNTRSFGAHVALAAVLSLAGTAAFTALSLGIGTAPALRAVLAALAAAQLGWTLQRSPVRSGRLVALAAWAVAAIALWHAPLTLAGYALGHAIVLWGLRCWFHHSSLVAMAADFGLMLLALCGAIWAALNTGSLLLALWCYFLVQAATVWLPRAGRPTPGPDEGEFRHAERVAEAALRRLQSR